MAAAAVALLGVGCASLRAPGGAALPRSFAVTPPVWATESPPDDAVLQQQICEALAAEVSGVTALSERPSIECAEDVSCLTQVGQAAGAERLVVARLARLGPTTLLRLQSVDVTLGSADHILQSVIEDTDDARLSRSLRDTAGRLARLYAPPRPWYRRPTTIVAGALVLAAAITAVVLATRSGGDDPDVTVVPPAP